MEVWEIDDGDDWRFALFQYLSKARLPSDKRKVARVQARAMRFCIVGDLLYKRTFEGPMLRCLSEEEGRYHWDQPHRGFLHYRCLKYEDLEIEEVEQR
ncbi:hypothetical protein DH2020_014302 [Rehmannia glutinosa]|uniref:Uncharacterized protein n=1 Tax=Rehmannia glutinosa TaxID=99300 RepID=A0ABR0WVZ7_REHGL